MGAADDFGAKARAARRFESFAELVGRWAAPAGPTKEVEKEAARTLATLRGLLPRPEEAFWAFARRLSESAGAMADASEREGRSVLQVGATVRRSWRESKALRPGIRWRWHWGGPGPSEALGKIWASTSWGA